MTARILYFGVFLVLFFARPGLASPGPMHFELSLGGYALQMSYQEATAIRPFDRLEYREASPRHYATTVGHVHRVLIGDVAFSFNVEFRNDRIFKIIGRFPPEHYAPLKSSLTNQLGEGRSRTLEVQHYTGMVYQAFDCLWTFPASRVSLSATEINRDYATLAIIPDRQALDAARQEIRRASGAGD